MTADLFTFRSRPDGRLSVGTHPDFWNQIGPFGGWLAAAALAAMRREVAPSFKPRSFCAHFFGSFSAGEIELEARVLRRQRTVVAVQVELRQDGQCGMSAQALFGSDREGQSTFSDALPPGLATPEQFPRWRGLDRYATFARQFDYRLALGAPLAGGERADSGGWLQLIGDARRDAEHLLLLADAWSPALWACATAAMPASTLSMNVLFHGQPPADPQHGFLATRHHTQAVTEGYADERGALWWPDGRLAVLAQQSLWLDFRKPHRQID